MKMENVNDKSMEGGVIDWAEQRVRDLVEGARSCMEGILGGKPGRGTDVNVRPRPDVRKVEGIKVD